MDLQLIDLSSGFVVKMGALGAVLVLFVILVASFLSRPGVFCQYLRHMTGIELGPRQVRRLYRARGRAGVRDHLIDLLIREDLEDPDRVRVTPDSPPDTSIFEDSA